MGFLAAYGKPDVADLAAAYVASGEIPEAEFAAWIRTHAAKRK